MNDLPWKERVTMLSINPDAASREDIANMAAELMETWTPRRSPSPRLREVVEMAREALVKSRGELEFQIEEMSDVVSYSHTNAVLEEVQSALAAIEEEMKND